MLAAPATGPSHMPASTTTSGCSVIGTGVPGIGIATCEASGQRNREAQRCRMATIRARTPRNRESARRHQFTRSTLRATASPPPRHSVARPRSLFRDPPARTAASSARARRSRRSDDRARSRRRSRSRDPNPTRADHRPRAPATRTPRSPRSGRSRRSTCPVFCHEIPHRDAPARRTAPAARSAPVA